MLDQTLFNGIGNYLRAEILFETRDKPFATVGQVLGDLSADNCTRHPFLVATRDVTQKFLAATLDYSGVEKGEKRQGYSD